MRADCFRKHLINNGIISGCFIVSTPEARSLDRGADLGGKEATSVDTKCVFFPTGTAQAQISCLFLMFSCARDRTGQEYAVSDRVGFSKCGFGSIRGLYRLQR